MKNLFCLALLACLAFAYTQAMVITPGGTTTITSYPNGVIRSAAPKSEDADANEADAREGRYLSVLSGYPFYGSRVGYGYGYPVSGYYGGYGLGYSSLGVYRGYGVSPAYGYQG